MPKIEFKDLLPADVLLFDIPTVIGRIVSAFDVFGFSHAALYLGAGMVAEAVDTGVGANPWNVGPWRSPQAVVLRAKTTDTLPILAKAYEFIKDGRRYAYGQLLLMAGICVVRQSGVQDPFGKMLESWLLDMAGKFIDGLHAIGEKPMVCSEFAFRCFTEAVPPCPISYDLFVDRGDLTAEEESEAKAKLAKLSPSFISPGDLYRSPSFDILGAIDVPMIPRGVG